MEKELYIPVNVPETKDIIVSGIAGKEMAIIGCSGGAGIILGLTVYALTGNMIYCWMLVFITVAAAFIAVRRDIHNESLVDKLVLVYRYTQAQKRFEYVYRGIKSPWEEK